MSVRSVALASVMMAASIGCVLAAAGHRGSVTSVAFSPDGRTALSASNDSTLILWDISRATPVRTFIGHTGSVKAAAFSADGRTAISGSEDGTVKVWDIAGGQVVRTIAVGLSVSALAVAADGREILLGVIRGPLQLWDLTSGQQIRAFEATDQTAKSVALSRDGRMALSANGDKTATLWEATSGQRIRTFAGEANVETTVAFSPDDRMALSGNMLFDVASGALIRVFGDKYQGVYASAFSPDGRQVLTSNFDKLNLWSVASGGSAQTFRDQHRYIQALAFAPDGRTALSGGDNAALKLWDLGSGKVISTFYGADALEGRTLITALLGIPALICWVCGFWLLWSSRRARAAAQEVQNWSTVDGTIVSSEVERTNAAAVWISIFVNFLLILSRTPSVAGGTFSYLAKVGYRYTVGDKSYLGDRIHFLPVFFKLRGSAEDALKSYPAGAAVSVHYKPQDPGQSVLDTSEPGGHATHVVMLAMAVVLTVLLAFAYFI